MLNDSVQNNIMFCLVYRGNVEFCGNNVRTGINLFLYFYVTDQLLSTYNRDITHIRFQLFVELEKFRHFVQL